jgi:L-cysteine:1D-myo-inositol 2-amino-2-deoxy-alpha-D-glucopyranoside ligase
MHTAMVEYEGEKMSKSLGNLIWVRELLAEGWTADAIRVCMAGHHYRESWEYVPGDLKEAAEKAKKLLQAVTVTSGSGSKLDVAAAETAFHQAMNNDLDTPAALAALVALADEILGAVEDGRDITEAQKVLRQNCAILGLRLDSSGVEEGVTSGWQKHRQRFDDF